MELGRYILAALEYGWDTRLKDLAWRVYRAQEQRHAETGILTAVTEDHLDRAPHFIFSSVVAEGEPWAVQTDTGEDADEFRILSTKAALGWHALYRTPYTDELAAAERQVQSGQHLDRRRPWVAVDEAPDLDGRGPGAHGPFPPGTQEVEPSAAVHW